MSNESLTTTTTTSSSSSVVEEIIRDEGHNNPSIIMGVLHNLTTTTVKSIISEHEEELTTTTEDEGFLTTTTIKSTPEITTIESTSNYTTSTTYHPSAITNLIHTLSAKLRGISDINNNNETLTSFHHHPINETTIIKEDEIDHHQYHHHDHHDHSLFHPYPGVHPEDGTLLHSDTIILVCSCVIMILLGLILRKLFLVASEIRNSRQKYRGGLRQFAEHMHVVTKSMSTDPEVSSLPPMTPMELRRMRSENFNAIFKDVPGSPHSMRKEVLQRTLTKPENIVEKTAL